LPLIRQHQHLGVEEPAGVLHQRQQSLSHIAANRLETTLRIGESGGQRTAQDQVVAPADELAFRTAHHPRRPRQPSTDRQVGVTRDERRDERQQRVEIGRQIDVHVREYRCVRRRPDRVQRPAAALLLQPDIRHLVERRGQLGRHFGSGVGRGVVRDRDPEGVREVPAEERLQPSHARRQVQLFVVDGDDYVNGRYAVRAGRQMLPHRQHIRDRRTARNLLRWHAQYSAARK
jgi:hypothetical protein